MSEVSEEPATHPVQTHRYGRGPAKAPIAVTLRAYEVYSAIYGPQEAMITHGCRGGFSAGELVAFLYARSFPKAEWQARIDEAFKGMENL